MTVDELIERLDGVNGKTPIFLDEGKALDSIESVTLCTFDGRSITAVVLHTWPTEEEDA